ncbi:TMV resistance protein N [Eucalyptus grandis]|uniref:TMV resistance protein N n=1 Tax=Eucalyptus grandis TaxID=71139 RepID=UPI00192E8E1A|nr:TMV resistance protein N [Eucalyptus grandis]
MLGMASAVTSTCCSVLMKSRPCHTFRPSRQLVVVSTKGITAMTVSTTVSTMGISEARKEGKAAATQSLGRGSEFAAIKSILKEVVPQSSFAIAFLPSYDQILAIEKFKSIIGKFKSIIGKFKSIVEKFKSIVESFKSIIEIHGQRHPRIFISYKRGDTLRPVSHLKGALERRGIRTVVDYTLDGGEEIWPAIEEVIKQSNIAVVVVSQNYHSSPWCLNELVKILECRKKRVMIVLPIFWEIDARVLQEPSSPFLENIGQGEDCFKQQNPHQVQKWRKALQAVGQIIGFPVSASLDKTEAELIEDLADKIAAKWYRSV